MLRFAAVCLGPAGLGQALDATGLTKVLQAQFCIVAIYSSPQEG